MNIQTKWSFLFIVLYVFTTITFVGSRTPWFSKKSKTGQTQTKERYNISVISCIFSAHSSLVYVFKSCFFLLILIDIYIPFLLSLCFPIVPLGVGIGRTPCLLLCSFVWRGRYCCLLKQDFGPLCKVMEYKDQQCLGLFLLELET